MPTSPDVNDTMIHHNNQVPSTQYFPPLPRLFISRFLGGIKFGDLLQGFY